MKQTPEAKTAYWQQHINHWQASDLSAAQYCQRHQVTCHCFIYWRSKLSREPAHIVDQTPPPVREGSRAFVIAQPQASTVAETICVADSLQLALPNGLLIQNIREGNLSTVRALLEHL